MGLAKTATITPATSRRSSGPGHAGLIGTVMMGAAVVSGQPAPQQPTFQSGASTSSKSISAYSTATAAPFPIWACRTSQSLSTESPAGSSRHSSSPFGCEVATHALPGRHRLTCSPPPTPTQDRLLKKEGLRVAAALTRGRLIRAQFNALDTGWVARRSFLSEQLARPYPGARRVETTEIRVADLPPGRLSS